MTTMKIRRFQGTSEEGDFQSALLETTNEALEALSIGKSDGRVAWKSIETSAVVGCVTSLTHHLTIQKDQWIGHFFRKRLKPLVSRSSIR